MVQYHDVDDKKKRGGGGWAAECQGKGHISIVVLMK